MKFEIKNRWNGSLIFSIETDSWKLAIEAAIKAKADLSFANLSSAKNAELAIAMTRILPEGDIIGWKKCENDVLAKLLIPSAAKRSHAFGRKCRAEYAEVLEGSWRGCWYQPQ